MKNQRIIILTTALMLLLILTLSLCSCSNESIEQQQIASACIRIHIRANSNSQQDQAVKLKVRDEITTYLQSALANCTSKKEARNTLERESEKLVEIANTVLYLNNFKYKTSVRLDNEYFPEKTYDEYTFPKGNYDALVISLGSGSGDNWWCVAFPPLCFIPQTNGQDKIVYKSWIKELLDKIFQK